MCARCEKSFCLPRGDGFNGDTMTSIPKQFWDAGALRHFAFAAEPEGNGVPCDSDFSSAGRAGSPSCSVSHPPRPALARMDAAGMGILWPEASGPHDYEVRPRAWLLGSIPPGVGSAAFLATLVAGHASYTAIHVKLRCRQDEVARSPRKTFDSCL